jgi:AcrR family transcriptional regulator
MTVPDDPRERLLIAAGELFAEKGFKGATVKEIITRAGVNIAAVNYYFRDKERLYIDAVKAASCGSQLQVAARAARAAGAAESPPAERLRGFIRAFVTRLLDPSRPAWHARLMMRELAQPTAACRELVNEFIRPTAQELEALLKEMLPPDAPRWKRMMTAFSIVGQCLHHLWCRPVIQLLMGDDYAYVTAENVADHIAEFSLAALGAKTISRKRQPTA